MEVPLNTKDALFDSIPALSISTPGAKRSTQDPQLEKDALLSFWSLAATVTAPRVLAGEVLHASWSSLPAAMEKGIPAARALSTAWFWVTLRAPPKDILPTAGLTAFRVTQSIPAITPWVLPEPSQPNTRTGATLAPLATPKVAPATVPAQ